MARFRLRSVRTVRARTADLEQIRLHAQAPPSFWDGSTGVLPVDTVIRRVIQSGYAHHIERLMVLGNFMILCEIDPDDVYRWFMEMFIDAYDWVMVPNVGGLCTSIATSSSAIRDPAW